MTIKRFVSHHPDCSFYGMENPINCDCGLVIALKELNMMEKQLQSARDNGFCDGD